MAPAAYPRPYASGVAQTWTAARVRAGLSGRVAAVRGAAWALRACGAAHRRLRTTQLDEIALPAVRCTASGAERGVQAVLRRTRWSCLERALVRQRWLAAHGMARDLLIGVAPGPPIAAHAWLEGDPAAASAGYEELSRHPA
jgi:hypothetical protein